MGGRTAQSTEWTDSGMAGHVLSLSKVEELTHLTVSTLPFTHGISPLLEKIFVEENGPLRSEGHVSSWLPNPGSGPPVGCWPRIPLRGSVISGDTGSVQNKRSLGHWIFNAKSRLCWANQNGGTPFLPGPSVMSSYYVLIESSPWAVTTSHRKRP